MRHTSQINDRLSAEWLAGYRAALSDLDTVIALMGPDNVLPFIHARLKAQLLQREAAPRAA